MKLMDCAPGSRCRVENLELPLELARRLEALGLIAGSTIAVLRKKGSRKQGAMIITVRGTRFAVSMKIAANITVRGEEHAA